MGSKVCRQFIFGEFMYMDKPPIIIPKEISYEWSQDLSRAAVRRFFLRRFRNSLLFFLSVSLLVLLALRVFVSVLTSTNLWLGFI
jgi:hypothetical protein